MIKYITNGTTGDLVTYTDEYGRSHTTNYLTNYLSDTSSYYWYNGWNTGTIETIKVSYFPDIEKVIFHDPATIVLWKDGTKTVVKCNEGDTYSKETGLVMCIAKKALGNKSNFNNVIKKWLKE